MMPEITKIVPDLKIFSALPWYHSYGILSTCGFSLCGATIITMPTFDQTVFLQNIQVTISIPYYQNICAIAFSMSSVYTEVQGVNVAGITAHSDHAR